MVVQLALHQLQIPPGQRLWLKNISWQAFEAILDELGDHRGARLAYDNGTLEIMMPLPEQEDDKEIVGDLVKALLEELDIEFRSLGSTTFKHQQIAQGLEPDQCFYIQNKAQIRGKKRIDLAIDPPPDLAIEIDITSRTHPTIYAALKVPELWQFSEGKLQISCLRNDRYTEVAESPNFPNLPLIEIIPKYLEQSKTSGRNSTLKAFRQWIRQQIGTV
jgi:Uma2 family endonuclease